MAKTQSKMPTLDQEFADKFDQLSKLNAQLTPLNAKKRKAGDLKKEILNEFGTATRVALPDGRILQRRERSREMPARRKETQTWFELFEADA